MGGGKHGREGAWVGGSMGGGKHGREGAWVGGGSMGGGKHGREGAWVGGSMMGGVSGWVRVEEGCAGRLENHRDLQSLQLVKG